MVADYQIPVINSKLQAPVLGPQVLHRPRLRPWLERAVTRRVTLVVAAAGYGKTTAVAELTELPDPVIWYTLSESDKDPLVFLAHIAEGIRRAVPGARGLYVNPPGGRASPSEHVAESVLARLANALEVGLSAPLILVLDDFHTASDDRKFAGVVSWLIQHLPQQVRFVICSRTRPRLPILPKLQASRRFLLIDEELLRFSNDEIAELMQSRGISLTDEEVQALAEQTEGWVLGLQLAEQLLSVGGTIDDFRAAHGRAGRHLFEYLAEEVLNKQPDPVRDVIVRTSVLKVLTPAAIEVVAGVEDGSAWLSLLEERNLFVLRLSPDSMRFHHLMSTFLRTRLRQDAAEWSRLNLLAGNYYRSISQLEPAFETFLSAGAYDLAAEVLVELLPALERLGRFSLALDWLGRLPETVRACYPQIQLVHARILQAVGRIHGAFDLYSRSAEAASAAGAQTVLSAALSGKATIFRDKGLADRAAELNRQALECLPPDDVASRAPLLILLAVTDSARGLMADAAANLEEALRLYEGAGDLEGQQNVWNNLAQVVFIRQARFADARHAAERAAALAKELEAPLLAAEAANTLGTVLFLTGEYQRARELLESSLATANETGAVPAAVDALVTLGHVLRYIGDSELEAAEQAYLDASARLAAFDPQHYLGIEAKIGLSAVYRSRGEYAAAVALSRQAVDSAERRGHQWLKLICMLEHAAALTMSGALELAEPVLTACWTGFEGYGDRYNLAGTALWRAVGAGDAGVEEGAACLDLVREGEYEALVRREWKVATPLLLRLLDRSEYQSRATSLLLGIGLSAVPAAIERLECAAAEAKPVLIRLLGEMGDERARRALKVQQANKALRALAEEALAKLSPQPAYTLHIELLGPFRATRDQEEVSEREWRGARSRVLLQYLAAHHGQLIPKERITEVLWPDLDEEAADNNFRFTLSALNKVLEPRRAEGATPYYIMRRGDAYGLAPRPHVRVDVEEFETLIREARSAARSSSADRVRSIGLYQRALDLYRDDFLPEQAYEDWSSLPRERLRELYFQASAALAELLLAARRYDEVVRVARGVLQRDSCREDAYRLLMRAHVARGDRTAAIRAYQHCVLSLEQEFGLQPLPETQQLYREIAAGRLTSP